MKSLDDLPDDALVEVESIPISASLGYSCAGLTDGQDSPMCGKPATLLVVARPLGAPGPTEGTPSCGPCFQRVLHVGTLMPEAN